MGALFVSMRLIIIRVCIICTERERERGGGREERQTDRVQNTLQNATHTSTHTERERAIQYV